MRTISTALAAYIASGATEAWACDLHTFVLPDSTTIRWSSAEIAIGAPGGLYQLGPNAIEYGRARYNGWLNKLAIAEQNNAWHGYAQQPVPFEVADDEPFSLLIGADPVDLSDAA